MSPLQRIGVARSALVTGASGFVGSHLVEALARRGWRVRCLVRDESPREHLRGFDVELAPGDVATGAGLERAVQEVEVVFHLAGQTAAFDPADLYAVNAGGSTRLAEACARRASPPVVVYCSSIAAAGPAPWHRPKCESDPAVPVSHYGRSKRAGERVWEQWAHALPTTIVRPGIVFGERGREALPMFLSVAWYRVHVAPQFHTPRLSFIHAADLAEMMILAAERGARLPAAPPGARGVLPPTGRGVYFACDDEHPTYHGWGHMLGRALESTCFVLSVPVPIAWCVAAGSEWLGRLRGAAPPLNLDKMREAWATSWEVSPAAAQRDLAFRTAAPLAQRLRQTVRWYREHGWL